MNNMLQFIKMSRVHSMSIQRNPTPILHVFFSSLATLVQHILQFIKMSRAHSMWIRRGPKPPILLHVNFFFFSHTCPRMIITNSNDQEERRKLFSSKSSARQTSEACLHTPCQKKQNWKTFASEEEEEEQRKCKTRTWSEIMMAKESMENNIPKEEIAEENGRDWSFDWNFFFFFYGTMVRVLGPWLVELWQTKTDRHKDRVESVQNHNTRPRKAQKKNGNPKKKKKKKKEGHEGGREQTRSSWEEETQWACVSLEEKSRNENTTRERGGKRGRWWPRLEVPPSSFWCGYRREERAGTHKESQVEEGDAATVGPLVPCSSLFSCAFSFFSPSSLPLLLRPFLLALSSALASPYTTWPAALHSLIATILRILCAP